MKTIELKCHKHYESIDTEQGPKEILILLRTTEMLKAAINKTPQGGYEVSDMIPRLRLLGIIAKFSKNFEFEGDPKDLPDEFVNKKIKMNVEDADFDFIKKFIEGMRWIVSSQFIVDFYNDIIDYKPKK